MLKILYSIFLLVFISAQAFAFQVGDRVVCSWSEGEMIEVQQAEKHGMVEEIFENGKDKQLTIRFDNKRVMVVYETDCVLEVNVSGQALLDSGASQECKKTNNTFPGSLIRNIADFFVQIWPFSKQEKQSEFAKKRSKTLHDYRNQPVENYRERRPSLTTATVNLIDVPTFKGIDIKKVAEAKLHATLKEGTIVYRGLVVSAAVLKRILRDGLKPLSVPENYMSEPGSLKEVHTNVSHHTLNGHGRDSLLMSSTTNINIARKYACRDKCGYVLKIRLKERQGFDVNEYLRHFPDDWQFNGERQGRIGDEVLTAGILTPDQILGYYRVDPSTKEMGEFIPRP